LPAKSDLDDEGWSFRMSVTDDAPARVCVGDVAIVGS
jgi:hypothetical protein